jgi:UDP-N-acetyl-D-mannosaminuronic acid transferase (WecB/TagA/CpsF family)
MKGVSVLGLPINISDEDELDEVVISNLSGKVWIGNLNAHALNLMAKDELFHSALKLAKYNFCDGMGLLILLKAVFFRRDIGLSQITYNQWFDGFVKRMSLRGGRFFFLGDEDYVIE